MWEGFVALARAQGFTAIGVDDIAPFEAWESARQRRNDGHGKALHADPLMLMPEAKRIIVLAHPYADSPELEAGHPYVRISPYYFVSNALRNRSHALAEYLRGLGAKVLEQPALPAKSAAQRSGIGSYGRNNLFYTPEYGSRVMLSLLLTDADLPLTADAHEANSFAQCEGCNACVSACPSKALDGALLDTSRCLRAHMLCGQEVPEALRTAMGDRLVGCEICQRVCPHNQRARKAEPFAELPKVELSALLGYGEQFASAMEQLADAIGANYARKLRVQAQAALIAGNSGDSRYADALRALAEDEHVALRAHARWALNKLGCTMA